MAADTDTLLLSHPFRLLANGSVATVADGTDTANAEAIAILALTRRGERPYVPDFGTNDPSFDPDMDLAELNVGLTLYGPDVTVTAITVEPVAAAGMSRVVITFDDNTVDED